MKKITKKFMKLSIIGLVLIIGLVAKESQVRAEDTYKDINSWMPDKTLQSVVSQSLFKPVSEITKTDMSNLSTLSFPYVQQNTQVDLTGLEFATNLKTFDSSNIIAVNIPQISIGTNGTLYTRPNVLKHIIPKGLFIVVGIREDTSLSTSDLIGVGHDLEGWEISSLYFYTVSMRDYSKFDLPPEIMENSYVKIMNRKVTRIKPIEIKDNVSQLLYSDENVKDTEGNLLLSSVGNFDRKFNLTAYNKSGVPTRLSDFIDYSYNADGIKFNSIPNDTDYIELRQPIPKFLAASRDYRKVNYDSVFQIPVKYLYSAKDVTAKYVDTDGNKISDDVVKSGNVGDEYSTEQKDIEGYTFKEVQGNATGQFTDSPQTVTYVYTKNPVKAADVISKYVDTEGKKISDDVVKSGNIGDKYTTEQKDIDGYTFKEMGKDSAAVSGDFTDKAQTVTYVYTKNPVAAADVTAKYVDTEGNKISDDIVKSGNIGDKYTTEQKDIDGYTFKEMGKDSAAVSGDFTDKAQTVTYVYTKDKVNPLTPTPADNKPSHKEDTHKSVPFSSTHDTLPETGENERMTLMSVGTGLILLMVALIASIFRFKKFKNNK